MKKFLLGGVAAAFFSTVALAQAPVRQASPVQTRADVAGKVQRHFARVDTNRDGVITQAEAQALKAKHGDRLARRADRRGQRNPGQFFERLDTNRDGQVTRAEFDARRAQRAQTQAAAPQRGEQMFAGLDSDRNGAISRAEFDAGRQQRDQRVAQRGERRERRAGRGGGFGGHMFAMADVNKDGRLTLQEAQSAALRRFDMADANRDGQVTREERQQLRQQMRGHSQHQRG